MERELLLEFYLSGIFNCGINNLITNGNYGKTTSFQGKNAGHH